MKNYISMNPIHLVEVVGLTNTICKQLDIPCRGMEELGCVPNLRDFINLISGKYSLSASVGNQLQDYPSAINQIANDLVNRNILDEGVLEQDLKEFLLKYPPLRF